VRVEALMGPGVDPHMYKASAGDVRRLAGAELILYNGLHLEAAMARGAGEMGRARPSVAVARAVPAARLLAPPEFEGVRPARLVRRVALAHRGRRVAAALIAADPPNAARLPRNAAALPPSSTSSTRGCAKRMRDAAAERRVLVTAHDAFNYFGRAYGFEVRGLQGINTAAEAGTATSSSSRSSSRSGGAGDLRGDVRSAAHDRGRAGGGPRARLRCRDRDDRSSPTRWAMPARRRAPTSAWCATTSRTIVRQRRSQLTAPGVVGRGMIVTAERR
jgi:hypothetical protein